MPEYSSQTPGDQSLADDLVERAQHARRMHHRQMIRRGLVALAILAIVGVFTAISFPVYRQLKTEWYLRGSGFRVDWNLDEQNWLTGGVTEVKYQESGWMPRSHDPELLILPTLLHVESLSLVECHVTEAGLSPLSQLGDLKTLNLARMNHFRYGVSPTGLNDACLVPLQRLTRLETLSLAGNKITDQGLPLIAHLPNLESLDLTATEVTDAGLPCLEALKSLKSVSLGGTRVTAEGIKRLKDANPNLDIDLQIDPQAYHELKIMRKK
jgi:Leucine Rich repeats (2 copies)